MKMTTKILSTMVFVLGTATAAWSAAGTEAEFKSLERLIKAGNFTDATKILEANKTLATYVDTAAGWTALIATFNEAAGPSGQFWSSEVWKDVKTFIEKLFDNGAAKVVNQQTKDSGHSALALALKALNNNKTIINDAKLIKENLEYFTEILSLMVKNGANPQLAAKPVHGRETAESIAQWIVGSNAPHISAVAANFLQTIQPKDEASQKAFAEIIQECDRLVSQLPTSFPLDPAELEKVKQKEESITHELEILAQKTIEPFNTLKTKHVKTMQISPVKITVVPGTQNLTPEAEKYVREIMCFFSSAALLLALPLKDYGVSEKDGMPTAKPSNDPLFSKSLIRFLTESYRENKYTNEKLVAKGHSPEFVQSGLFTISMLRRENRFPYSTKPLTPSDLKQFLFNLNYIPNQLSEDGLYYTNYEDTKRVGEECLEALNKATSSRPATPETASSTGPGAAAPVAAAGADAAKLTKEFNSLVALIRAGNFAEATTKVAANPALANTWDDTSKTALLHTFNEIKPGWTSKTWSDLETFVLKLFKSGAKAVVNKPTKSSNSTAFLQALAALSLNKVTDVIRFKETIDMLWENGADSKIANTSGQTPTLIAEFIVKNNQNPVSVEGAQYFLHAPEINAAYKKLDDIYNRSEPLLLDPTKKDLVKELVIESIEPFEVLKQYGQTLLRLPQTTIETKTPTTEELAEPTAIYVRQVVKFCTDACLRLAACTSDIDQDWAADKPSDDPSLSKSPLRFLGQGNRAQKDLSRTDPMRACDSRQKTHDLGTIVALATQKTPAFPYSGDTKSITSNDLMDISRALRGTLGDTPPDLSEDGKLYTNSRFTIELLDFCQKKLLHAQGRSHPEKHMIIVADPKEESRWN